MANPKKTELPKFPKWLPKVVGVRALELADSESLYDAEPLLRRLLYDPEMERVWKKLKHVENKQKLVEFFEFIRLHESLQGDPDNFIEIPSDKSQRITFNKVARNSEKTLQDLARLTKSGSPDQAWALLESALKRSELFEIGSICKDNLRWIQEIQARLKYIQAHIAIPILIETISVAAMLAIEAPDDKYPIRRNTPLARTNKFILDLHQFFMHVLYIAPSHTDIATIVNTAFQSADGGISADNVRKLLEPEVKEVNSKTEN